MPRLNYVKKAKKDNPAVKKGESYYWWQFAFGVRNYSKNKPARSQLTQSSFLSQLYDMEDVMEDEVTQCKTPEDLLAFVDDLTTDISSLRDECEENLSNMPEHLQELSSAGQLLQERIEAMEQRKSHLEDIEIDSERDLEETKKEILDTITNTQ